MNTITTNLCNYTGKSITVDYTDAGEFEMYGYKFWLEIIQADYGKIVNLQGSGWRAELATFYYYESEDIRLSHLDDEYSLEKAIRQAIIYIANYV
jgi:hypothetical protein